MLLAMIIHKRELSVWKQPCSLVVSHEEQGNAKTDIRGSDSEYQQHEEHKHVTNDAEEPSDSGLQQYLPHEEQGNVETEIRGSDSEYQQHEEHEHVTNDAEEPYDSGFHHDFSTHHFSKGTMGENTTEITPLEQDLLHLSSVEDDKISVDFTNCLYHAHKIITCQKNFV
uniref:BTB domain-containing protein n=1 Tax=Heterorhabditis bacteriophora TaxID=37862 RepID=A0A1I7XHF0_HETBA